MNSDRDLCLFPQLVTQSDLKLASTMLCGELRTAIVELKTT
jgi:hypothetical protein